MKVPMRMGSVVATAVRHLTGHGRRRQQLLRLPPTRLEHSNRFYASSSSSSSSSTDTVPDVDTTNDAQQPPKYEHVRKLIVGLGNPGDKFAKTRHNVGAMAVTHFLDAYAQHLLQTPLTLQHDARVHGDVVRFALPFIHDSPLWRNDLVSAASERRRLKTIADGVPHPIANVALLTPTTYMNRSGASVAAFMRLEHWRLKKNAMSLSSRQDELLVVTDDVALPFGTCRFKPKGSDGGQNGVRDIIKSVNSDRFARLKVGIGASQWFVNGATGAPAGAAVDKFVLSRFDPHEQDQLALLLDYVDELLRLFVHRGVSQAASVANSMDLETYRQLKKTTTGKKNKNKQ